MATGAAAEASETDCSICHEAYSDPKLLTCGHVFCEKCLLSWLKTHTDAACPLCRHPIVKSGAGKPLSLEAVVDSFPTDLTMKSMVRVEKILGQDQSCKACLTQAAASLCLECQDFLCGSCVAMHGRISATKNHKVEKLSSLTAENITAAFPSPCDTHPSETAKLFCTNHNVSMCVLCASSTHRSCPEVKGLDEKTGEARSKLKNIASELRAKEAELNRAIQQIEDHLQKVEKESQAAVVKIDQVCDGLQQAVTLCRERLKGQVLKKKGEIKESGQSGKSHLLEKRGLVTTHSCLVDRVERRTMPEDLENMATVMEKRVEDMDCSVSLPAQVKVIGEMRLDIDTEAVTSVEKVLSELGQVRVSPAALLPQNSELKFHTNHGTKIVLTNNQQTAEKKGDGNGGIVVSCQPMVAHGLYEVRLDERGDFNGNYMWVGVTTAAPDTLTIPATADRWSSAVVINNTSVDVQGKEKINTMVGQKLVDLPKGSRVGVMMDKSHALHLYIDGKDQGVASPDVPQPCFPFFDIYGSYRKITALPVTVVS